MALFIFILLCVFILLMRENNATHCVEIAYYLCSGKLSCQITVPMPTGCQDSPTHLGRENNHHVPLLLNETLRLRFENAP